MNRYGQIKQWKIHILLRADFHCCIGSDIARQNLVSFSSDISPSPSWSVPRGHTWTKAVQHTQLTCSIALNKVKKRQMYCNMPCIPKLSPLSDLTNRKFLIIKRVFIFLIK